MRTGFWFYLGALTATLAHPGGFVLTAARGWLERHVRSIAALLLLAIAAALLRNGIAGLTD